MGVGTIKQDQEKDQEFSVKSTRALEAEPEKMKAPRWKQGSGSALPGHIAEEPQENTRQAASEDPEGNREVLQDLWGQPDASAVPKLGRGL